MAFEAGRGGSGLEPKLAGLRLTPAEIRRTPPPDPPGPRTDPGRTRHRTIRTRGTGGAHIRAFVFYSSLKKASFPGFA